MDSILNFIFESNENIDDIFDLSLSNKLDYEKFVNSAVFGFLKHNYKKSKFGVSNNLQTSKSHKNLFLIECIDNLYDIIRDKNKNNEINLYDNSFLKFVKNNNISDTNTKFLISSISEATPEILDFEKTFILFCNINNIDYKKFVFIDSNYFINDFKLLKGFYIPHFIVDGGQYLSSYNNDNENINELNYRSIIPKIEEAIEKKNRKNYFLSLNRSNHKLHRTLLGCFFSENDNKISWSYLSKPSDLYGIIDKSINSDDIITGDIDDYNDFQNPLKKMNDYEKYFANLYYKNINLLKNTYPKELDTQKTDNKYSFRTSDTFDDKMYYDSYFNIVTESRFDEKSIFFTEKIVKPIIGLQPFIVVSTPNYLEYFRKLGFETFENIFNEDYDHEEDDYLRLYMIINEIKKIQKMSEKEVLKLYESAFEKCVFNRNLLIREYNNLDKIYTETFKQIENEW